MAKNDDLKQQASDVAEAARDGISDMTDAAATMVSDARRAARPAIKMVRAQAERAAGRVQEVADDTYRRGKSVGRSLAGSVRSDTLVTAAAAFALGCGLSYFLRSRK